MEKTADSTHGKKVHLSVEVDHPETEYINDTFESTPMGSLFISGEFKLTSIGVETIPQKNWVSHLVPNHYYPSREPDKEREKIQYIPIENVEYGHPKYTAESLIIINQIGAGSSSRVYKCIYVPTLSLVAVSLSKVI
jgi:hypothetical protein